jgi:RNA polymerase sigma-70 factor (ECF subfamily)
MFINPYFHQTPEMLIQEQIWVSEAKQNPRSFDPLYRKYYHQVFQYLKSRINDIDKAYDITSQVFEKAIQNISKFEDRGLPFGSWLYRIAKSELYQSFRDCKDDKKVAIDNVQIAVFDEFTFDNQDEERMKKALLSSIQCLKSDQIKLIEMRFFQRLSFKEIGENEGITENNAKVKTFRAVDKLRSQLLKRYAA